MSSENQSVNRVQHTGWAYWGVAAGCWWACCVILAVFFFFFSLEQKFAGPASDFSDGTHDTPIWYEYPHLYRSTDAVHQWWRRARPLWVKQPIIFLPPFPGCCYLLKCITWTLYFHAGGEARGSFFFFFWVFFSQDRLTLISPRTLNYKIKRQDTALKRRRAKKRRKKRNSKLLRCHRTH